MIGRIFIVLLGALGTSIAVSRIHYEVDTCIVAELNLTVTISKPSASPISMMNVPGSDGECKDTTNVANLLVNLNDDSSSLIFQFKRSSSGVFLELLTVKYKSFQASKNLTNERLSDSDTYFECDVPKTFSAFITSDQSTVDIDIQYIKVQAFSVVNNTYSGNGTICAAPSSTAAPLPTTTASNETTTMPVSTTTASNETTTMPVSTTTASNETTTMPVSNTTASNETTTMPVSTTTASDETTTMPVSNTTASDETTTMPVSTANVSDETTTLPLTPTSQRMTTSSPPKSKKVILAFKENGTFCVVVSFNGTIKVQPPKVKNPVVYNIASATTIAGMCGTTQQTVQAKLANGWIIEFNFAKSNQKVGRRLLADSSYHLSQVDVTYTTNGASQTVRMNYTNEYEVDVGKSYKCNSEQSFKGGNVDFSVSDFQAEAFRTSNSTNFSSSVECDADSQPRNNTVPIVVGVCLTVLVIVIVIAYFIGRRRQQQNNPYQSMN